MTFRDFIMTSQGVIVGALLIVAGMISIETGVSTAILEILTGVIGANLLNLTSQSWLEFLANFGLLGLMFYAGFETDMEVLAKNWKESLLLGSLAYFTPFIIILATGYFPLGLGWKASLLLAIALSTTSLAIVYPILKQKGMLHDKTGQLLLSGAMVVDLLSMFTLTIGFEKNAFLAIIFFLLIFPSIYILPRLGHWLFDRYGKNIVEYEVRFLLLMMLSLGLLAESIGLHAAIIAYLSGLFWNELFLEDEAVIDKLKGIIFGFFAPAFFFSAGLSIKFANISSRLLWLIPLLTVIAITTKYVGAALGARLIPRIRKLAHFTGALFNFQLSFSIVAAILGLESGIITLELYTAILGVILASALIASLGVHVIPREY